MKEIIGNAVTSAAVVGDIQGTGDDNSAEINKEDPQDTRQLKKPRRGQLALNALPRISAVVYY